jgi:hypothetical protein
MGGVAYTIFIHFNFIPFELIFATSSNAAHITTFTTSMLFPTHLHTTMKHALMNDRMLAKRGMPGKQRPFAVSTELMVMPKHGAFR